jgi:hypothetical protein
LLKLLTNVGREVTVGEASKVGGGSRATHSGHLRWGRSRRRSYSNAKVRSKIFYEWLLWTVPRRLWFWP